MRKKICFIAAAEITVKAFLIEHLKVLSNYYDLSVITNTDDNNFLNPYSINVNVIPVAIERKISPLRDITTFLNLFFLFKKYRFDIACSITPKSGLLSMLAAYCTLTPARIHIFTGQVWATSTGIYKRCLKLADKVISFCATHILVDSHSQRDFLIKEKVISESKSHVIANGSICGVDTQRFSFDRAARKSLREKYLIGENDIIFLYLGRLKFDKGLLDLAQAFTRVCEVYSNARLVVVGPDEENMKKRILQYCETCSDKLSFEDYTNTPEKYMAMADVFCLPSYREGFGMTIIEAGSVGIPSIGTRIYGIIDAIEENITGFICMPRDIEDLRKKMLKMIDEPSVRLEMGKRARERAIRLFSKDYVVDAFLRFYQSLPGMSDINGGYR
jgi:glycosyltransferase involved in cell wall biosynthesis